MMIRLGLLLVSLSSSVALAAPSPVVNALKPILEMERGEDGLTTWQVDSYTVRGATAEEMLRDYAERILDWQPEGDDAYVLNMRMSANEIPDYEADSTNGIGLAKIVDVVALIASDRDEAGYSERAKTVRSALFAARAAGGLVGAVSSAWGVCGTMFSGVLVLDVKNKKIHLIVPRHTDC